MNAIKQFLSVVEAYCRAKGVSEATLSTHLFDHGSKIALLREGKDIMVSRLEAAMAMLSGDWPQGIDWPKGVERPRPIPMPSRKNRKRAA